MTPSPWRILLHLVLVYISWGSTYLGLKLTLEVLGPFMTCGARMTLGGLLFCLYLWLRGHWQRPSLRDGWHALGFGVLMVLMASGFLSKGQEYIDSSVAALVSGSTPISMLVAAWLFAGEERPSWPQWLGLAGGLLGLLLLGGAHSPGGLRADPVGMCWVLVGTFAWVGGSLAMRHLPLATALKPQQSCALLLLAGGLESLLLGFLCGEGSMTHWECVRPDVLCAFAWMVLGGSILAYNSYFWLLSHVSIATAVSYEYVVPIIGILLGWQLGGESVSSRMLCAAGLTVGSVFLVIWHKHNR